MAQILNMLPKLYPIHQQRMKALLAHSVRHNLQPIITEALSNADIEVNSRKPNYKKFLKAEKIHQ